MLEVTEGQGRLASCSPWGHRVRHSLAREHQKMTTMLPFSFQFQYWLHKNYQFSKFVFLIHAIVTAVMKQSNKIVSNEVKGN